MQKFAASNEVLYCAHTCNCWRRLDDDSIEWCLSVSHNPSSLASNHHSCARCFCVHVLVQMVVLAWLMAFKLGLQGVPQASRGLQWLYLYTGGAQEEHVTVTTDKIDLSTQRQEQERRQQQGQGQLEPPPPPPPPPRRLLSRKCILCMDHITAAAPAGSAPVPAPPTTTSCGHVFCHPCIVRWLAMQPRCPICRTPQQPQQVRILYNL